MNVKFVKFFEHTQVTTKLGITPLMHVYICIMCTFCIFSDTAYRTRIQLAVLDHNSNLDRSPKLHRNSQEIQHHRKFRKQTHNWDVVKVMQKKQYTYIPEMMKEILMYWQLSDFNMKSRTITERNSRRAVHVQPSDTATIVNNKRSRFQ